MENRQRQGNAAGQPPLVVNVDGETMRAMFASSSPLAARLLAEYEQRRRFTGFASGASGSDSSVAITPRRRPMMIDAPPGFPVRHHSVTSALPTPPPPAVNPSPPAPATLPAPEATSQETQTGAQGPDFSILEPNVVYVEPGEDVSLKIMDFCLSDVNSILSVCVMSTVGSISRATLRRNPTSTGCETVEGCLEIMSLGGSYDMSRVGGERSIIGELNITLAKGDGRVIAGSVGGPLIAASRVQVVLGSRVVEHDENIAGA